MTSMVLISHRGRKCGVQQFGRRLFDTLQRSPLIDWKYAECDGVDECYSIMASGPDAALFNYHPETMPWLQPGSLTGDGPVRFGIQHEFDQASTEGLTNRLFDFLLCADPTLVPRNPVVIAVPRFSPEPRPPLDTQPGIFTVGSFGFSTPGKGFDRLCELVNSEFDKARIRINIPHHDSDRLGTADAFETIVGACRAAVSKTSVTLEITRDFLDDEALLDFLAENTINAFLYDPSKGRGISSCIDYALACGRPIAVSASEMFRNLHRVSPSVCVEKRSLREIASAGVSPLRHHIASYAPEASGSVWNRQILAALERRTASRAVPDKRGFNKILDDRSRDTYSSALADLRTYAPTLLGRKIARANIQQAFGLDTAERFIANYFEPRILAVGSFEDTTVAVLRAKGYEIEEIDPDVNGMDLGEFVRSGRGASQSYDVILCISVLEHVWDDGRFVRMIAELLAPGGVGIFTVDFSNAYPRRGRKPHTDQRLYTTADIKHRLMRRMPDCVLVDLPAWDDGTDEFHFEGTDYSFASWVFRKVEASTLRYAIPDVIREEFAAPTSLIGDLAIAGDVHTTMQTTIARSVVTEAQQKVFAADGSATGFLVYGPYCSLSPGSYECTFLVKAEPAQIDPQTSVLVADLALGCIAQDARKTFTYGDLTPGAFVPLLLAFEIPEGASLVETRLQLVHRVAISAAPAVAIRRV